MAAKIAHDFGSFANEVELEKHLAAHKWGASAGSLFRDESEGALKIWDGKRWVALVAPLGAMAFKSLVTSTQGGAPGLYYVAGYYDASTTDEKLTQDVGAIYGTPRVAYGARAFIVAGGAGTKKAALVVKGTSVDAQGVRTAGDSEVLVADVKKLKVNQYVETAKRWVGTVTWKLDGDSELNVNYGFAQCDSFGGRDVVVEELELSGRAGAMDPSLTVELHKHCAEGWTYAADRFVPGGDQVLAALGDYAPDDNLVQGGYFSYRREGLGKIVQGSKGEGVILRIQTTVAGAVEYLNAQLGVTAV
jgi:hypothetical protein